MAARLQILNASLVLLKHLVPQTTEIPAKLTESANPVMACTVLEVRHAMFYVQNVKMVSGVPVDSVHANGARSIAIKDKALCPNAQKKMILSASRAQ